MVKIPAWLSTAIALLAVMGSVACSSGGSSPLVVGNGNGGSGDITPPDNSPCADGATRECSVTLGRQGSVVSCYHGTQTCSGGVWGTCSDGVAEEITVSQSSGLRTQALSTSVDCVNNPCNPFCKTYQEQPAAPITSTSNPTTYNWSTGTFASLPPGLANKGIKEPCTSGYDCQFNQKCTEVVTASACSHSKCVTGGALVSTCDTCVADICATKPNCCTPPANACGHDVCEVGKYLKAGCSTCVDKVCAKRSSCCSKKGSWDATCFALAQSECGVTCPCNADEVASADKTRCYYLETTAAKWSDARTACKARGTSWELASVGSSTENDFIQAREQDDTWIGLNAPVTAGVYTWSDLSTSTYRNWASGEPNKSGNCVYLENNSGSWYDDSCNNKLDYVCEGPAKAGSSGSSSASAKWDQSCVDAVKTICDATCGAGNPPAASGDCTPWLPGKTDSTCNDIDLAVGVPCDNSIPVCNHGTKTAPAGIKLVHFPANSQQYPKCAPDLTHPQMKTCTTTAAIPPGQCIDLKNCTGLTGNREIMVNPQGISGYVNECNCRDNWSLYSGGTCGAPACSGSNSAAAFKPVNMLIMFDKSGSMNTALTGGGTRWSATTSALKGFVSDAGSAGIGVALRFFPDDRPTSGCNDSSCNATACSDPLVEAAKLTAAASPTDAQEKLLVDAINATSPGGTTPTYPALDGALDWAFDNRTANPDEIWVVVLVTDGQPTKCNTDWAQIRQLSADAYNNYGTRTYVIGIQGSNVTDLDLLAGVGGTGKAFVATSSNATQMQQELTKALQSIAGQNVSCTFALPNPGEFDPNNVSVVYTAGSGTSTKLNKVTNAAACGNGWYYDNNANPTSASLCPTTCGTVQADTSALVQVQAGCPGTYAASTSSQQYQGKCPAGTFPQWGFFTYDTVTPADSSVVFSVRAATTQAGLATATPKTLATAKSTPTDTQKCTKTGPTGCPVDLYALLGSSAKMPYLQVDLVVNPTSSKAQTATVNNWEVTYSCPPSE